MKKLLLMLFLIAPNIASAQLLPDGCYVSFSNPNSCYSVLFPSQILVYNTFNLNTYHYGDVVGELAYRGYSCDADKQNLNLEIAACTQTYNLCSDNQALCVNSLQNCSNNLTNCNTSYTSAAALNASKNSLIKRLRKACGTKCKKIK